MLQKYILSHLFTHIHYFTHISTINTRISIFLHIKEDMKKRYIVLLTCENRNPILYSLRNILVEVLVFGHLSILRILNVDSPSRRISNPGESFYPKIESITTSFTIINDSYHSTITSHARMWCSICGPNAIDIIQSPTCYSVFP